MLSFIPIIGPFIQGLIAPVFQGVGGIFSKYWDSKVAIKKEDVKLDIAMAQESTKVIEVTKDDWGVRLNRDLILTPVSAYIAIYVWDKIVDIRYPNLTWGVRPLDYMPFLIGAVLSFLLGNAALHQWTRK